LMALANVLASHIKGEMGTSSSHGWEKCIDYKDFHTN
jgi:hypothetical protein